MTSKEIKAELKRRGYKTIRVSSTGTNTNWITARFQPDWKLSEGRRGNLIYAETGFSDDLMREALVVVYGPDFVKDGRISGGNISRYSIALIPSQWEQLLRTPFESHREHAKKASLSTPCNVHHVNFGGGCLNCGWEPNKLLK